MNILMGALVFYFKYNVGNEELVGVGLMGLGLPMLLLIPFTPMLTRKIEKKWLLFFCLLAASLFALIRFFIPNPGENLIWVILTFVMMGVIMGPSAPISQAMIADLVDYADWKHNVRAEGIISSITPLVTKFASGIGGALPGYVLAATGYVPDAVQTPEALRGIALTTTVIPFGMMVLGAVVLFFYPLTKVQVQQIQEDIFLREGQLTKELS